MPWASTQKIQNNEQELASNHSMAAGYKVNKCQSLSYIIALNKWNLKLNWQAKNEIRINLRKYEQKPYEEIYKTQMKITRELKCRWSDLNNKQFSQIANPSTNENSCSSKGKHSLRTHVWLKTRTPSISCFKIKEMMS